MFRFWSLLDRYCPPGEPHCLPVVSSFGRGRGQMLCVDGKQVHQGQWTNLSAQDLQPSFFSSMLRNNAKVHVRVRVRILLLYRNSASPKMFDMKVLISSWYMYIHVACVKCSHMIMVFVELHMHVHIINPRRACAARVTVVVLCVCLFVSDYSRTTGYEVAYERYQQIQCHKGRKECGDFAETTAFERYGVKTS